MVPELTVFIVITVFIIIIDIFVLIYLYSRLKNRLVSNSNDFLKRSHYVLRGKIGEQMVPFSKDFPYNSKDMMFLGNPIDYLIFDGLSQDDLKQIVFLEVKSGQSKLNNNQKQVKSAVLNKKIVWDEYRID